LCVPVDPIRVVTYRSHLGSHPPLAPAPLLTPPFDFFSLQSYLSHPDLHSFPTRRSSDLSRIFATKYPTWTSSTRDEQRAAHISTDRKSTRLNSSHVKISYAVFCLKKKRKDGPTWSGGATRSPAGRTLLISRRSSRIRYYR